MSDEVYIPYGTEWINEMMKLKKGDLVLMLKSALKIKNITTLSQSENICEGIINDFESGISTKEETMAGLGLYTSRLMELFWEQAIKKIKADPTLLE